MFQLQPHNHPKISGTVVWEVGEISRIYIYKQKKSVFFIFIQMSEIHQNIKKSEIRQNIGLPAFSRNAKPLCLAAVLAWGHSVVEARSSVLIQSWYNGLQPSWCKMVSIKEGIWLLRLKSTYKDVLASQKEHMKIKTVAQIDGNMKTKKKIQLKIYSNKVLLTGELF